MCSTSGNILKKFNGAMRDESGITLLEVMFSLMLVGIMMVGYFSVMGASISTRGIVSDANTVAELAFTEIEQLRALDFGQVPFAKTSDAAALEEVPNYFHDILSDLSSGTMLSTGDLNGYPSAAAIDNKRADDTTAKWVAQRNLLTDGVSGGPDANGPWDDDIGGGGSGGPGGSGPGEYPDGYQFWMIDLQNTYKLSRIVYDNRFNRFEAPGVGLDSMVHLDDVWQKKWRVFFRETPLGTGEPFDPRSQGETIKQFFGGGYGSSDVNIVWDDPTTPIYAGVLGVTEIDTYSDFDTDFHWPYINEVEAYGFDTASAYLKSYTDASGVTTYNNVITWFPNYKGKAFDMGRRVYIPAEAMNFDPAARFDLFKVQIEFYPHSKSRNTSQWMKYDWWQKDSSELSRYMTSFYSDRFTRRDDLPLLNDLPMHQIYEDNEDFFIDYTVPGATSIRLYFSVFDLQPDPSSDLVSFYDKNGTQFGELAYYGRPGDPYNLESKFSPWVDGDTIVVHFHSDGIGNSAPPDLYRGFKAARVEIRK